MWSICEPCFQYVNLASFISNFMVILNDSLSSWAYYVSIEWLYLGFLKAEIMPFLHMMSWPIYRYLPCDVTMFTTRHHPVCHLMVAKISSQQQQLLWCWVHVYGREREDENMHTILLLYKRISVLPYTIRVKTPRSSCDARSRPSYSILSCMYQMWIIKIIVLYC